MEYEKVIRERKATRLFSKKSVEQDKIDMILEAGRVAPTAKNSQAFKIYVVNTEEGLAKIDKATICRYKAPLVFIICGDKAKAYKKDNEPKYEIDACIVTTHMMLEATNVGLDNIWIEMFKEDVLRSEFDIPENLVPVALLPVGYKAKLCPPSPLHKIRKNIQELVIYK